MFGQNFGWAKILAKNVAVDCENKFGEPIPFPDHPHNLSPTIKINVWIKILGRIDLQYILI